MVSDPFFAMSSCGIYSARAQQHAAMRGLEGVKKLDRLLVEWRGTANPGGGVSESAHAAMRGLTRNFRAAFARKCSVCPRIAPQGQSGRHGSVATTVHEEFAQARWVVLNFHTFVTPTCWSRPSCRGASST